jgi:hypothetical protein
VSHCVVYVLSCLWCCFRYETRPVEMTVYGSQDWMSTLAAEMHKRTWFNSSFQPDESHSESYNKPMRQRRVIWGNGLVGYKLTISFSKCVALCRWKMDRSPIFLPDNGLRFPRLDEYAGGRDAQEDVAGKKMGDRSIFHLGACLKGGITSSSRWGCKGSV